MVSTLSVNFYCRTSKKGKDNLSPVEMGVNVNGERFFVNLPRRADSRSFQRLMSTRQASPLREHLAAIETALRGYETRLLQEGKKVSAAAFKEFIRNGYSTPEENVGYLFDQFHNYILEKGISKGVIRKYEYVWELFLERVHIKGEDFLDTITKGKIRDFAEWVCRNYKSSSAAGMLTKLKGVFIYGEENKIIPMNPFAGYKIKKSETTVELPSIEDYNKIKNVDLSANKSLERVRDLWLFASGSGLAYCDCARLKPEDFQFKDGHTFINKERAKTGVEFYSILLPIAEEIAKKYNYSMPVISNQKINLFLKTVAEYAGVDFRIHFHLARHIYCHQLLNTYKMSYQSAAKMLGHKQLKQTMHYGKIWGTTVMEEFDKNNNGGRSC